MKLSCFLSQCLLLVFLLAMQLLLIHNVSSMNLTNSYLFHKCRGANEKIYGSKSKYMESLNSEIRNFASYKFKDGFTHESVIEPPNTVTIMYWCRGDSYGPKCRSCFATAVAGLRRRCKVDSVGAIWYDQCFLETSGERRAISNTDFENPYTSHNPQNINRDINTFDKKLLALLNRLTLEAGKQENKLLVNYAAGEEKFGTNKLYAMVQCVQYINYEFCKECLESNIKELSKCCGSKQGARVLNKICNLRYELYPFLTTPKTI